MLLVINYLDDWVLFQYATKQQMRRQTLSLERKLRQTILAQNHLNFDKWKKNYIFLET